MADYAVTRRHFLRSTTRIGLTMTLASALCPPVRTVYADEGSIISVLGGLEILRKPDVQEFLGTGVGALWVAGSYLNVFAQNLNFNNLPPELILKYRLAGAEWKSFPAAKGLWETIPAPVRAGGPEALWKFHKGKDWSHIIPKSWGGPTTAENGIWWSSEKNKILGDKPMSPADIADAKAVLRQEAIRATIVQTLSGMIKGAMLAVVVGALLACLECGLEYAEGNITWNEMVYKIVESSIIAGVGAFIITGLIVGISLLFPFVIPIFMPVSYALQIVSLVFLGRQLVPLAKGWWEVLKGQELLDASTVVLKDVGKNLRSFFREAEENILNVVRDWISMTADRVGLDKAWELAVAFIQQLGVDRALVWFAAQTEALRRRAGDVASFLKSWDYQLEVDESGIRESIVGVVTTQFQDAIATTDELLRSISDIRKDANMQVTDSLLAV